MSIYAMQSVVEQVRYMPYLNKLSERCVATYNKCM